MAGRVGRLVVRTMGEIISGCRVGCLPSNPPLQLLNPKAECTLSECWLTLLLQFCPQPDCKPTQTNCILRKDQAQQAEIGLEQ